MYGLADPPVALAAWMLNQPRTMAPRLMAASRARSDQPGEVGMERTREAPGAGRDSRRCPVPAAPRAADSRRKLRQERP